MSYNIGNITLSNPYYNMGTVSISPSTNYTYSTGSSWTTAATNGSGNSGSLQVSGDAEFKGKVKINGQDLVETLQAIQDRLAILVPDPTRLEKYEALRQAYEHYKTLEALCIETDANDKQ